MKKTDIMFFKTIEKNTWWNTAELDDFTIEEKLALYCGSRLCPKPLFAKGFFEARNRVARNLGVELKNLYVPLNNLSHLFKYTDGKWVTTYKLNVDELYELIEIKTLSVFLKEKFVTEESEDSLMGLERKQRRNYLDWYCSLGEAFLPCYNLANKKLINEFLKENNEVGK